MAIQRKIEGNSGVSQANIAKSSENNCKQTSISIASTDDHFADFFRRELEKKEAILRQVYSNNPEKLKETLEALHRRYKV